MCTHMLLKETWFSHQGCSSWMVRQLLWFKDVWHLLCFSHTIPDVVKDICVYCVLMERVEKSCYSAHTLNTTWMLDNSSINSLNIVARIFYNKIGHQTLLLVSLILLYSKKLFFSGHILNTLPSSLIFFKIFNSMIYPLSRSSFLHPSILYTWSFMLSCLNVWGFLLLGELFWASSSLFPLQLLYWMLAAGSSSG